MTELSVHLSKKLPQFDLEIKFSMKNEILVLFGPSGSGKSTTLQMIAGLSLPNSGTIHFNGQIFFDQKKNINIKPQHRSIGYVFQNHSIFPHMTIRENILFGAKNLPFQETQERLKEFIRQFQLESLENKHPSEISGGEQQRVALAVALMRKPRLLLLDEPFSALDERLRLQMRSFLKEIKVVFDMPIILVTHDRAEAQSLAEQMIIYKR